MVIAIMQQGLSLVEQEILDYIRHNPGRSKADIVRHLRNIQLASRITVLEYIKDLEIKNMIYGKKERPNSQIIMMYINEDNKLASVLIELKEFKEAFIKLLEKSKQKIDSKDYSVDAKALGIKEADPSKWQDLDKQRYFELDRNKMSQFTDQLIKNRENYKKLFSKSDLQSKDESKRKQVLTEIYSTVTMIQDHLKIHGEHISFLIFTPVDLFYTMVDLMFYRSVIKWPDQIKDKEMLSQMYFIVYSKIAEIQLELSSFIKSIKVWGPDEPIKIIVKGRSFRHLGIWAYVDTYYTLNMRTEIKGVLDSLIKLNEDIKELKLFELDTVATSSTYLLIENIRKNMWEMQKHKS